MYEYRCEVIRVVDGDTVDVKVDLGFRHYAEMRVRLAGIDAPEVNAAGPEGEAARDYLKLLLPVGAICRAKTEKPMDKYGRWLAWLRLEDKPDTANELMVAAGHANAYDGGAR